MTAHRTTQTVEWEAIVERADGSVHGRITFPLPANYTADHARGMAWNIWHEARAYGSTLERPAVRQGLVVRRVQRAELAA